MTSLFFWLWALLCHNPNHTPGNHGNCNLIHVGTVTTSDTGGENGGNPKPPPPPPPPPPVGS